MATYYLRFEGVNLVNFVEDCKDLNTIRGGSLLLLDAATNRDSKLGKLSPISTGASAGWYSFEAANEDAARQTLNRVRERLREGPLEHATVVLDAIQTTGNFERDREALLARNRYRQMQSASVVYPKDQSSSLPYVCEIDGVRPLAEPVYHAEGTQWLSHSVAERKKYGRREKRGFYLRVTEGRTPLDLPEFAQSFEDIGDDLTKGNLHRKLAVLYIDGNRFGEVQAGCRCEKESQEWDKYIQYRREDWLYDHLKNTLKDRDWLRRVEGQDCYRMEILLWGGDDIIVVVPAWQGWSTLEGFFAKMRDLNFNGDRKTHSAGLVFCHQKTSIHTITPLADELCKEAKRRFDRKEDALSYQVLESFDTLGSESEFEEQRRKMAPVNSSLALTADMLRRVREGMQNVQRFIPRRKLHEVVRLYLEPDHKKEASDCAGKLDKTLGDVADGWKQLRTIFEAHGDLPDPVLWVHLNELWDYLPEVQP